MRGSIRRRDSRRSSADGPQRWERAFILAGIRMAEQSKQPERLLKRSAPPDPAKGVLFVPAGRRVFFWRYGLVRWSIWYGKRVVAR